ncbi:MAG TPA: DnaB-like helicase C-terminal domain-containing protein [Gemmatimonadales bacterium]|nr:DnaB-like helicase C-terminal domain-containing protein [Gemmatimonadales bacterium]
MTPRRPEHHPSPESLVERVDQQRPGEISGDTVPTGFPSVDRLLGGGLRRRDLVVLGGDIGSGKSALALGLALRVARRGAGEAAGAGGGREAEAAEAGVAFFSGEMDEERLTERALAIEGRVAVDELRSARLSDQSRASLGGAAVRLRGLPLTNLQLAAPDFETMAQRLDPLRGLGLVVVDYLQLVPSPAGTARSTQDEDLALVLQRLKALALERRVALLVVAQLPRFEGKRQNPRPNLDDFGHLGAIKQHADVVLGIYREDMYNPGFGVDGATELLVLKNRNGPTGFVDLYFYRRWMRFEDMLDPDR